MSYLALCSFDLQNGSRDDYTNAYDDLSKLGFNTRLTADNGNVVLLPTTTTVGFFEADNAASLRNDLIKQIQSRFNARGFTAEIFVVVGGNWAWSHRKT